jgi:RNA polymerase sigma-B factor
MWIIPSGNAALKFRTFRQPVFNRASGRMKTNGCLCEISMTEDELNLWRQYDESRKRLIAFYLPLVDRMAKFIARSAGPANWEDLRQDGTIGLMKAIERFDPDRGVPFRAFARNYVRGAIYDSSELTRDMARQQEEIYRRIKAADSHLTKTLHRTPTIEEIARQTDLTIEQIQNALDARGIAFAGEMPDDEELLGSKKAASPQFDKTILLDEALSRLTAIEQQIVRLHYLEDQPHEKIAEKLEIIPAEVTRIRQRAINNVTKICQRAIKKLNRQFNQKKGKSDEDRRDGK